jgi:hypothetical protein
MIKRGRMGFHHPSTLPGYLREPGPTQAWGLPDANKYRRRGSQVASVLSTDHDGT